VDERNPVKRVEFFPKKIIGFQHTPILPESSKVIPLFLIV
jgi:hypothetical protein